jgi:hypothetical protein
MLRQCEFNGRKDVLHFKLLQAAINENNANKISAKNPNQINQKSAENSMLAKVYHDKNREIESYREQAHDNNQYDFDDDQYQDCHNETGHASEKRKKRISSSMGILDPRSKRKCENPYISKPKTTNQFKRPLPLSGSRKALRNSHGIHNNTAKKRE